MSDFTVRYFINIPFFIYPCLFLISAISDLHAFF
ncbi:hypothetical protein [Acinetobacter phage Ab69]|nr:hypothetical protein [Acinetobacter phage Ab69]